MKIDSPKAFRAPERKEPTPVASQPQPTPAAPKSLPNDGFVPSLPGNKPPLLGGTPPSGGNPPQVGTATPHFDMPSQLEQFRDVFARVGKRIASNPRYEDPKQEEWAIERAASQLAHRLPKDVVEAVGIAGLRDTVRAATAAFRRGPDPDDEQFGARFASDRIVERGSPKLQEQKTALQQIAFPIASNSASKSVADILKEARPQVESLGLEGRDKAQANRYIASLVKELRARETSTNPPASRPKPQPPLDTGDWRKNLQWKP